MICEGLLLVVLIDNYEKVASFKNIHTQFKTGVQKSHLIDDQNGQYRYPNFDQSG